MGIVVVTTIAKKDRRTVWYYKQIYLENAKKKKIKTQKCIHEFVEMRLYSSHIILTLFMSWYYRVRATITKTKNYTENELNKEKKTNESCNDVLQWQCYELTFEHVKFATKLIVSIWIHYCSSYLQLASTNL